MGAISVLVLVASCLVALTQIEVDAKPAEIISASKAVAGSYVAIKTGDRNNSNEGSDSSSPVTPSHSTLPASSYRPASTSSYNGVTEASAPNTEPEPIVSGHGSPCDDQASEESEESDSDEDSAEHKVYN